MICLPTQMDSRSNFTKIFIHRDIELTVMEWVSLSQDYRDPGQDRDTRSLLCWVVLDDQPSSICSYDGWADINRSITRLFIYGIGISLRKSKITIVSKSGYMVWDGNMDDDPRSFFCTTDHADRIHLHALSSR